jgi:hypothetical protein
MKGSLLPDTLAAESAIDNIVSSRHLSKKQRLDELYELQTYCNIEISKLANDSDVYERYARGNHSRCPCCGSGDFEGTGEMDYDGDWVTNELVCRNCDAEWRDVFTLSDIDVVKGGNPDRSNLAVKG